MRFKRNEHLPSLDVLIFDMDGVLIDVSGSYRKTIQRTAQIYLESCLGFKKSKRLLITDEDISLFKSVGHFNNDWDLTSGLLLYLLSISGIPSASRQERFFSIEEVVSHLKKNSFSYPISLSRLLQKKNILPFSKRVKSSGGGLKGVRRALGGSWDGWVYRSGDLDQENVIKRIFQEVYLGKMFSNHYPLRPLFYRGKGYYLQEKPLISRKILSALRKKVRMGIASGRPRFEAELALKRFHLLRYFDSVVTLDECEEEEARILHSTGRKMKFSKPHPYSILKTVKEIGVSNPRCGYVGDVVDDIVAAKAVKKKFQTLAIGFISHSKNRAMKKSLFQAGADVVIEDPKKLLRLITRKW